MDWDAFYTVHHGLPREGPGDAESVALALEMAGTPRVARICDAACGPGADTLTLALLRPDALIDALDAHEGFVAQARERAQGLDRVMFEVGDMRDLEGPYDLIWCAGAIYFLGVEEGLRMFRKTLNASGAVAFTEPVRLGPLSERAERFWAEYPALTDIAGVEARIAAAGFETLGTHVLPPAAWEAYYQPLEARMAELRRGEVSPALEAVLAEHDEEIAVFRTSAGSYSYALFVVRPA